MNGCSFGDPVARSIHNLIWNLSEVSKEATQKMCELVENGVLPCYLLTKSIFENKFWYIFAFVKLIRNWPNLFHDLVVISKIKQQTSFANTGTSVKGVNIHRARVYDFWMISVP